MIQIVSGDLLKASAEALVNPVNTVGVMGKGLAFQFRRAFQENFAAYESACEAGELLPGRMFVFEQNRRGGPRYIINFPTKRHWRHSSRMEDIESGLAALITEVKRLGIQSIAVPALGCGLGGLNWNEVKTRIENAFAEVPTVEVFLFSPAAAATAKKGRDER